MSAPVHSTPFEDAIRRGRAWRLSINALDPTGGDDIFAYFKNTGNRPLVLEKMELGSTVAGNVEPQRVTGIAASGTAQTTALANLGSSSEKPDGDVETGVNITGLTNVFDLGHYYLVADVPRQIPLNIRIPVGGGAVAFNWEEATGILSGSIDLYETTEEDK